MLRSLRAFPLPTLITRPRLGGVNLSATLHTHRRTGTPSKGEEASPMTASLKRALPLLTADATYLNVRKTIENTVDEYRRYVAEQEKLPGRLSCAEPIWTKGGKAFMKQGTGAMWRTIIYQHEDILREMLIETGTTEEKDIRETLYHLHRLWPLTCEFIHDYPTETLVRRKLG